MRNASDWARGTYKKNRTSQDTCPRPRGASEQVKGQLPAAASFFMQLKASLNSREKMTCLIVNSKRRKNLEAVLVDIIFKSCRVEAEAQKMGGEGGFESASVLWGSHTSAHPASRCPPRLPSGLLEEAMRGPRRGGHGQQGPERPSLAPACSGNSWRASRAPLSLRDQQGRAGLCATTSAPGAGQRAPRALGNRDKTSCGV